MRRLTICEGYTKSNKRFKLVLIRGALYTYYPDTGYQKRYNHETYEEVSDFSTVKADLIGRGYKLGVIHYGGFINIADCEMRYVDQDEFIQKLFAGSERQNKQGE